MSILGQVDSGLESRSVRAGVVGGRVHSRRELASRRATSRVEWDRFLPGRSCDGQVEFASVYTRAVAVDVERSIRLQSSMDTLTEEMETTVHLERRLCQAHGANLREQAW